MGNNNNSDDKNEEDLVLTPGGLRPKRSVIHVRPKEVVRRTDNGNYTIIQEDETKSSSD
jgi:hypothetical protein